MSYKCSKGHGYNSPDWIFIAPSLPPSLDLTQGLFYSWGFREGGGQAGFLAPAPIGHRLSRCNVRQMTLLGLRLTKCSESLAHMTTHSLN